MKISKRNLRKVLKKALNESMWIMNDAMGGPQDQAFPEGTTVDAAANQMVVDMDIDFPGAASEAASILRSPNDLEGNLYTLGLSDDTAEAIDDALESLDAEGSGNFEHSACCAALFDAINARAGSHFIEESRRYNLQESSDIYPRPQHPMIANAGANTKQEMIDLITDILMNGTGLAPVACESSAEEIVNQLQGAGYC